MLIRSRLRYYVPNELGMKGIYFKCEFTSETSSRTALITIETRSFGWQGE